jgi:hypothetical protein
MTTRCTDPTPTVLPLPEDLYPNGKPDLRTDRLKAHTLTYRVIPHDILFDELARVLDPAVVAAVEADLTKRFGSALIALRTVAKAIQTACWSRFVDDQPARDLLESCQHPIFDTYVE